MDGLSRGPSMFHSLPIAPSASFRVQVSGFSAREELRSLFRRGAAEEVSEELRLCMTGADTDEKKKECFGSDDIREAVGNSMGRDKGDVKDSDVREFLDEGVKEEIWTLLESCPEDSKERCMTAAKEMLAAVSGEEASGIPDDKVRKLLDDEMASALGERMGACMAEAADDGARESCRTSLATGVLGVTRGEAPSRTDMEEALTEAGRNKAKEVSQSCQGSREECMEKLREEAAKSMGLSKEDLDRTSPAKVEGPDEGSFHARDSPRIMWKAVTVFLMHII